MSCLEAAGILAWRHLARYPQGKLRAQRLSPYVVIVCLYTLVYGLPKSALHSAHNQWMALSVKEHLANGSFSKR